MQSAAPKPKSKKGIWLSLALLVAIAGATFYIIFRDNPLPDILAALKGLRYRYLLVGVLLMVGYFLFQAAALLIPLHQLGKKTRLARCVGFSLVGFLFSGITPSSTGGQPMQLYYMNRAGIPIADSSLALLIANIVYQVVVMLYGVVMLIVRFSVVKNAVGAMTALIIYGYVVTAVVLVALIFVCFSPGFAKKVVNWMIRVLGKIKILKHPDRTTQRAQAQLDEYARGAAALKGAPFMFVKTLLSTIGQMTCYFAVPYCVYLAFGLSDHGLLEFLAVQSILFIAVSYLPLPGAMGASEKGFVSLFSVFWGESLVVPAMLLSRGLTFYLPLVLSAAVVIGIQLMKPVAATLPAKAKIAGEADAKTGAPV